MSKEQKKKKKAASSSIDNTMLSKGTVTSAGGTVSPSSKNSNPK